MHVTQMHIYKKERKRGGGGGSFYFKKKNIHTDCFISVNIKQQDCVFRTYIHQRNLAEKKK